jgi:DNA excision repair protein ERCC-1
MSSNQLQASSLSTAAAPRNAATSITSKQMLVNPCQKSNPILKHLTTVPYTFMTTNTDPSQSFFFSPLCDFQTPNINDAGMTVHIWFLSCKYHRLHPDYIRSRLEACHLLGRSTELPAGLSMILLLCIDVEDDRVWLKELSLLCMQFGLTLLIAHGLEEAGKTLGLLRSVDSRQADRHRQAPVAAPTSADNNTSSSTVTNKLSKEEELKLAQMVHALSPVPTISKTNVAQFVSQFKSFEAIFAAKPAHLQLCVGVGPKKAQGLYDALHTPFMVDDNDSADVET